MIGKDCRRESFDNFSPFVKEFENFTKIMVRISFHLGYFGKIP